MNQPPQAHINTYLAVCTPSPEDGHHWSPRQLRSRRTLHPQPWPREIAKPCKINTHRNGEAIGSKTTEHCNPRYRGGWEQSRHAEKERALELGRWLQLVSALLPGLLIGANQDGQRGPWNVSVGIVKRAAKEKKGEQPQLQWADGENVDKKEPKAQGEKCVVLSLASTWTL